QFLGILRGEVERLATAIRFDWGASRDGFQQLLRAVPNMGHDLRMAGRLRLSEEEHGRVELAHVVAHAASLSGSATGSRFASMMANSGGGLTELPTMRTCCETVSFRPSAVRSMMYSGGKPCARYSSGGVSIRRVMSTMT